MTLKRHPYFDQDGQPISLRQWADARDDFESRRIAFDVIEGPISVTVITMWHGVDIYQTDPPLIFGTLVKGGAMNGHEQEWATKDEALRGHAALVQRLRPSE